jgi:hypothetical protein
MEGFDLIKVSPPSNWRQATVRRTVAFDRFKSLHSIFAKKKTTPMGWQDGGI